MRILSINPTSSTVHLMDDQGGHDATVNFSDISFPSDMQGFPIIHFITICCPVCQGAGIFPVAGGNDPRRVQLLFIYLLMNRQPGRTWEQAKVLTKTLIAQQEGAARWVGEDLQEGDS